MNANPEFEHDPEDPERLKEHWRIMEKADEDCDSRELAYKRSYTMTFKWPWSAKAA